jgi:membrane associated rhomboid family serine protease
MFGQAGFNHDGGFSGDNPIYSRVGRGMTKDTHDDDRSTYELGNLIKSKQDQEVDFDFNVNGGSSRTHTGEYHSDITYYQQSGALSQQQNSRHLLNELNYNQQGSSSNQLSDQSRYGPANLYENQNFNSRISNKSGYKRSVETQKFNNNPQALPFDTRNVNDKFNPQVTAYDTQSNNDFNPQVTAYDTQSNNDFNPQVTAYDLRSNKKFNPQVTAYDTQSNNDFNPQETPYEVHSDDARTLPSNPFEYRKNYSQELPPIPVDPFDDSNDIERKLKVNEKNRIRNIKRLPRFHWTKLPYFTIVVTLIQIIVFIVELVKMSKLTGSAFQTKPYFNPMLGPSTYLLINMGARYIPCMHPMEGITTDTSILFPCPNATNEDTNSCNLSQLCGLTTIKQVDDMWLPNQWYRIFIPIFLHAGFLHIIFNLLLQVTMGASVERSIGILKYAIIYISSGIGGFLLGANFTPPGIASTGASGALFGILATNIIMFIYCGKKNANMYGTKHYGWFIFIMIAEVIISFALGLLPGMDNFSHIGGFAIGILTAVLLLPDPWFVYADGIITYEAHVSTLQTFKNNWNPLYNHSDKLQRRVMIWIAVRVLALVLLVLYFSMLAKKFFIDDEDGRTSCSWCKYISCIPVNGWCDVGDLTVTSQSGNDSRQTEQPKSDISSTQPSSSSLPSSIVNEASSPNSNLRRKRLYEIFENSKLSNISTQNSISENTELLSQQQIIGFSFYLLMVFLAFAYFRKKRSHQTRLM